MAESNRRAWYVRMIFLVPGEESSYHHARPQTCYGVSFSFIYCRRRVIRSRAGLQSRYRSGRSRRFSIFLANLKSNVGRKCGHFRFVHMFRLLWSYPHTVYIFRPIRTVPLSILQAFTLNLLNFDIP